MATEAGNNAAVAAPQPLGLTPESLEEVLEVTRRLAGPFDLMTMLATVAAAARQVLHADRASVWLHDSTSNELVLEVATDIRHVRVPVGTGFVGVCARDRTLINVPDCYADPRFDPEVDRLSGYRTRCSLTLPLVDHDGALVGVMQLLNRADGVFSAADERLAQALAAQCAVALQRARATQALIEGEKMRQELEVARLVQTSIRGPMLADLLCYLRLFTELALRAKGLLMLREHGLPEPAIDADTRSRLEELQYLEASIGATGLRALKPLLHMRRKDLWQLYLLKSA